jgi:hypothetical protein
VPDPQDHQSIVCDTITKYVFCPQDLEDDLAILTMPSDRVTEVRLLFEHPSFRENLLRNDGSERGLMFVEKGGKAIEVSESSR